MTPHEAEAFVLASLTDWHDQQTARLVTDLDLDPEDLDLSDLPGLSEVYDIPAVMSRAFDTGPSGALTLREWVTARRLAGLADQHRREPFPIPDSHGLPCPDWCDDRGHHDFGARSDGAQRTHSRRFGDRAVCAALELRERSPDVSTGLTDLALDPGALLVRVHFGLDGTQYLTGPGARSLAASLIAAADLYDAARETMPEH